MTKTNLSAIFLPTDYTSIELQTANGERVSISNFKILSVSSIDSEITNQELFCINPLKVGSTSRHAHNLLAYRNFLLESDDVNTPVSRQLELLQPVLSDFRMLTFSGGKSIHCLISCADSMPFSPSDDKGPTLYREVWQGLCDYYSAATSLRFDPSTKNPNRLSRIPNVVRSSNNSVQRLYSVGQFHTAEQLMALRKPSKQVATTTTYEATSTALFMTILNCSNQGRLFRDIMEYKVFSWAAPQSMRALLFKYACWAIDLTNCTPEVLLSYLNEHTFPVLLSRGYPASKLEEPIFSAFRHKGLL